MLLIVYAAVAVVVACLLQPADAYRSFERGRLCLVSHNVDKDLVCSYIHTSSRVLTVVCTFIAGITDQVAEERTSSFISTI